ncbi:GntR family transcriptional regulator [Streptomyces antimycoticus]|uniref:GntR family transcriptional regulator n=1 Tax=Streptomyces TaxID=1883 RepID=UPI0033EA447B
MPTPPRGTPHTEIAAYLRQLIDDGALRPGESLPSMRQVGEQFGASPGTVNKAFALLRSEGLTYSKAGVGTVVAEQPRVAATGAARLKRLETTGNAFAPGESSANHRARLVSLADPTLAGHLGVDPHDEVVLRTRTYLRGGKPTVVAMSCIHPRALGSVPELLEPGPSERFWQELYTERTGREITRSPERRTARLASQDELDMLGVQAPPNAAVPVLVLVNVFHDEDGPIEVWEDVYTPGYWQIEGERP